MLSQILKYYGARILQAEETCENMIPLERYKSLNVVGWRLHGGGGDIRK
jgi:hypothetical protein